MSCVTSYLKGEDITGGDWAHLIRSRRENLFIRPILGGAFTLDFFSKTNTEASCKLSRVLLLTGLLICQSANCNWTDEPCLRSCSWRSRSSSTHIVSSAPHRGNSSRGGPSRWELAGATGPRAGSAPSTAPEGREISGVRESSG